MTTMLTYKRSLALSLAVLGVIALCGGLMFNATAADAAGGCGWDTHTEIDYFATAAKTGAPVGWIVRTCTCNVYSDGHTTPYYTTIAETPCDGGPF